MLDMNAANDYIEPKRGAEIAKAIRGCGSKIVIAITTGAMFCILNSKFGWAYAVLGCVGFGFAVNYLLDLYIKKTNDGLTVLYCFAPLFVSIFCGIVFMPIELLAGNLFSVGTCIYAGVLLSIGLLCYRSGRVASPYWLVMPALTFFYEILPIDLPTPIDNLLSLSVNSVNFIVAMTVGKSSGFDDVQEFGWRMICNEGHKALEFIKRKLNNA